MFDKEWFKKHQRKLLWLLNTPIIRTWFRWVLRIESKERITEITPNSYSWGDNLIYKDGVWKKQRTTDFRTHNKYSKRLYYAFLPLWKLFHWWDTVIANRLNPAWNLGFDTFYPDPDPETTTVDGFIQFYTGDQWSWSNMHDDDGTNCHAYDSDYSERPVMIVSHSAPDTWTSMKRGIFLFDTSSLGSETTIDSAVFSLYGNNVVDTASWEITVNVYEANPSSNTALEKYDYDNFGTTAYCDNGISVSNWNTSGYNDFTFNSTGKAAISKTGITKLGVRDATYDVPNSAPSWENTVESAVYCYFADQTGTNQDPKLVITYAVIVNAKPLEITSAGLNPTLDNRMDLTATILDLNMSHPNPLILISGGWQRQPKHSTSWTPKTKHEV